MSSSIPAKVHSLISVAQVTLARHQSALDPVGIEARRVLALLNTLPPLSGWFPKSTHPVTAFIGAAVKNGGEATAALMDVITPVIRYLPWKDNYVPHTDLSDLGQRMGWAELIGPEAPYRNNAVCLGLTLIAPDTHDPAHHHPANELYYVITGTATWILDGVPHHYPPGSLILHPSQSVHAIRTGAETVLALYTRSGPDIATLSDYSI